MQNTMEPTSDRFETLCFRLPMSSPDDVSGILELVDRGDVEAQEIQAIIAKTEGNGRVNDFTRALAVRAYSDFLAARLGIEPAEVGARVALVMSGGCEGVMSPHALVLARRPVKDSPAREAGRPGKRLAVGVAFTRELLPEEIGTLTAVDLVADAVRAACRDAGVDGLEDAGYIQVKCPLLTPDRIAEAERRGQQTATTDTYRSMSLSNGASALGVAVAMGEVDRDKLTSQDLCTREDMYSLVASCSSGVELMNCEVVVIGNSSRSQSRYRVGRAVMDNLVDARAVTSALRAAGLEFDGLPDDSSLAKVAAVLIKAGVPWDSTLLGRRTTLLSDTDLGTRPARAVVSAVAAGVLKDPAIYASAGMVYHQGPVGGGIVAAIVEPSSQKE